MLDPATGELTKQRIAGRPELVVEWLETIPRPFQAVYEAGPTGYGLARRGGERGLDVVVCSPGHITKNATDRIKTDERDATRLARLLLAGELRLVRVPEPAEEQLRDLVRAREDLRVDLMRCRHRISKFLLRREIYYPHPGNAWTGRHRDWLSGLRFADRSSELVLGDYLHAHDAMLARRELIERALGEIAEASRGRARSDACGACAGSTPSQRSACTPRSASSTGSATHGFWPATSGWSRARTQVGSAAARAPSRKPAANTHAGCWSRRPGITATPLASQPTSSDANAARTRAPSTSPGGLSGACTTAGSASSTSAENVRRSSRSRSRANWPASAGSSPCSSKPPTRPPSRPRPSGRHEPGDSRTHTAAIGLWVATSQVAAPAPRQRAGDETMVMR